MFLFASINDSVLEEALRPQTLQANVIKKTRGAICRWSKEKVPNILKIARTPRQNSEHPSEQKGRAREKAREKVKDRWEDSIQPNDFTSARE